MSEGPREENTPRPYEAMSPVPGTAHAAKQARGSALQLFFGGILPVIAFTVIEEKYGTIAGLIAGMAFGAGEIAYELIRHKRVSKITWFGNGMLLALGAVSLATNEGIWFKLQPAILEAVFAAGFIGSLLIRKNLLTWIMRAQGQELPAPLLPFVNGLCFRVGLFFLIHAALATHAAYNWSTEAWALLKGVGFMGSFVVYLVFEGLYLRTRIRKG